MKVIITESQYNRMIDYYISYYFDPHEVTISEKNPNSIFWIKDGEIIVETDNSKFFWINREIWKSISRMFNLDYSETQSVINMWLEQHHNLGKLTPRPSWAVRRDLFEQHYNLG